MFGIVKQPKKATENALTRGKTHDTLIVEQNTRYGNNDARNVCMVVE